VHKVELTKSYFRFNRMKPNWEIVLTRKAELTKSYFGSSRTKPSWEIVLTRKAQLTKSYFHAKPNWSNRTCIQSYQAKLTKSNFWLNHTDVNWLNPPQFTSTDRKTWTNCVMWLKMNLNTWAHFVCWIVIICVCDGRYLDYAFSCIEMWTVELLFIFILLFHSFLILYSALCNLSCLVFITWCWMLIDFPITAMPGLELMAYIFCYLQWLLQFCILLCWIMKCWWSVELLFSVVLVLHSSLVLIFFYCHILHFAIWFIWYSLHDVEC